MSGNGKRERRELPLAQALALGLLHGPSELLPISSSAHTTLVPWLLGWRYQELDPLLRKSFEVALHLGTALALIGLPPWRSQMRRELRSDGGESVGCPRPTMFACALAPPALAGYALGEQIERRLGTPATIASGLLAGTVAMALGELSCGREGGWSGRVDRPDARDGLALGAAQALALAPGVSRSGLAVATARCRGFGRLQADRLSWQVGLPIIGGAALLQGARFARRGVVRHEDRKALLVGALGALLSTRASTRLLDARARARLLPATIVYRAALAALVIRRMRDNTGRSIQTTA